MKVAVNQFALRHTAESEHSHFAGTWEDLVNLVEGSLDQAKSGYRDGVILVPVPPEGFFSSVVEVTPELELEARFRARREGEQAFLQVVAIGGQKQAAKSVDIVLYRHDVLEEDNDASSQSDWEIVAILARTTEQAEPMDPVTMARNFLHLPGGTAGDYGAREFAEAIIFWSRHVKVTRREIG